MEELGIIENAPVNVLIGEYLLQFGSANIESFILKLTQYKNLPNQLKKANADSLISIVKSLKNNYPKLSFDDFKKKILLMNSINETIDRSFVYPKTPVKDKAQSVKINHQKKTNGDLYKNIYFQKDALESLPFELTTEYRLVVILKDNIPYISFTKESINGVSFAISMPGGSGSVTSNLSKENQDKLEIGEYLIDFQNIIINEKNKFFKLNKI